MSQDPARRSSSSCWKPRLRCTEPPAFLDQVLAACVVDCRWMRRCWPCSNAGNGGAKPAAASSGVAVRTAGRRAGRRSHRGARRVGGGAVARAVQCGGGPGGALRPRRALELEPVVDPVGRLAGHGLAGGQRAGRGSDIASSVWRPCWGFPPNGVRHPRWTSCSRRWRKRRPACWTRSARACSCGIATRGPWSAVRRWAWKAESCGFPKTRGSSGR